MIAIGVFVFLFSWIFYGRQEDLGQNHGRLIRSAMVALLAIYIYFIISLTLINRSVTDETEAKLVPLWSWYQVIANHSLSFLEEIVLNIILFIPLGILLKLTTNISAWKAFLIGFGFSLVIESLEYVLCRGLFEWDDMLHNALGCMIGALIVKFFKRIGYDSKE